MRSPSLQRVIVSSALLRISATGPPTAHWLITARRMPSSER